MDEVISLLNLNGVRYLLIGGQAMRLEGMPRFSMDWDVFIPPTDQDNIDLINRLLEDELDMPVLPRGPRGENFVQTYQTSGGTLQFHLGGPGLAKFEEAEMSGVWRVNENSTSVRSICT